PAQQEKLKERDHLHAEAVRLGGEMKFAESLAAFQKKIVLERELYGAGHPVVLASLERLAYLHELLEDFPAARLVLQEAVVQKSQQWGQDHWQVADARRALAYVDRLAGLAKEQRVRLR